MKPELKTSESLRVNREMKRGLCLLLLLCLLAGCAAAETEVQLPGSRYALRLPDWMIYSPPETEGEGSVYAYISRDLEMDYVVYSKELASALGLAGSMQEIAEAYAAAGMEAELRLVNGIEMVCWYAVDEVDGTPLISYMFRDEDETMIGITFLYATQEAADLTAEIMTTIH